MGDPVDEVPEDVRPFRGYVGASENDKDCYRRALELMFSARRDNDEKK